jgi:hypothetical protein
VLSKPALGLAGLGCIGMDLSLHGHGWAGLARSHMVTFHANTVCQLHCDTQRFDISADSSMTAPCARTRAHSMYTNECVDIKVNVNGKVKLRMREPHYVQESLK